MFSGIVSEVGDVLGVSSLSSGREVSIHVSDDSGCFKALPPANID